MIYLKIFQYGFYLIFSLFLSLSYIFAQTAPPVYVVVFTHIEDDTPIGVLGEPESRQSYIMWRNKLISIANLFLKHKTQWVFEPDWKFLLAALMYEDSTLMSLTNNKNLLRYLKEDLNVVIDPHSHEKQGYNYTDVAHLLDSLGVGGSTVIGGHVWDPNLPQFSQWDRFRVPVPGSRYPWALWRGDILMGSGTPNHTNDPQISGVWRPKDRYHFFEDDPQGNIVCVGQYKNSISYDEFIHNVSELVNLYITGKVPVQYMLTASKHLTPGEISALQSLKVIEDSLLLPLLKLQAMGKIKLTDYTSLVNDWKKLFGARAYIYDPDNPSLKLSTFIPSEVGGSQGLYCEIHLPPAPRYAEGAPIVVQVPGGWEPMGNASPEQPLVTEGFIQILFNFPGGGNGGQKSGGIYDERGEKCIRALRDIVLFALGKKTDRNGRYLGDLTGDIKPLYSNVGLCGWSNGGNATITVAGAFPSDLVGLAWIVNWESPVGDGMPNVEAGGKGKVNPAYDPNTGTWDFTNLKFSDTLAVSSKSPEVKGGFYFDLNRNGYYDAADFRPDAYVSKLNTIKVYYSVRLRTEAQNRGLVPPKAPNTLATLEETRAFWYYRNGENWIESAITGNPNLMFIVTASEKDHVQGAPDHPHILIQYEAFRKAGACMVRLNPDRVYVEAVGKSSFPKAVDNPAFKPYDHLSIRNALEPDESDGIPDALFTAAAVVELADRTQFGNLSAQLDSVLLFEKGAPIIWKPYFTLMPEEGTLFEIDTNAIFLSGGVPVLNLTSEGAIVLTSVKGGQLAAFEVRENGKAYLPITYTSQRGFDGGFIYLPDGRVRFLSEEPAPDNTPQRHKSRIVSWISSDGKVWAKEAGVRYQPTSEDDSIASVPSFIQVKDSLWRMYYVGDWYRSNGIRTAISKDWGLTWTPESKGNILRNGDVDPHAMYLSNGKIRLYFRGGMNKLPPAQSGISYCDSDDGLNFDTFQVKLLLRDSDGPEMLKLDPAVIKFPNGDVACYFGAMPPIGQPGTPKLMVAWAKKSSGVRTSPSENIPNRLQLEQNYPNPFNSLTIIRFTIPHREYVMLKIFDVLGKEIANLVNGELNSGEHSVVFDASNLSGGMYFYQLRVGSIIRTQCMVLIK